MHPLSKSDMIINFLLHVLGNEESEKVQALMCIGISKLLLAGIINDDRVRVSSGPQLLLIFN
jgi:condensin complex subunit 3